MVIIESAVIINCSFDWQPSDKHTAARSTSRDPLVDVFYVYDWSTVDAAAL